MSENNKVAYYKVYEQITAIATGLNRHEKELLFKLLKAQLDWESSLDSPVNQEAKIKFPNTDDWVKDMLEKSKQSKPFVGIGEQRVPIMYPDISLADHLKPLDVKCQGMVTTGNPSSVRLDEDVNQLISDNVLDLLAGSELHNESAK